MRRAAILLVGCALLACAAPEPPLPGAVRVDVIPAAPLPEVPPRTPPIHLVLDLTSSMGFNRTEGVTHLQAARHAAGRFLRALPPDAEVALHALGTAAGSGCTDAVSVEAPSGAPPGAGLARIAEGLPSRSEGSLEGALEALAARLGGEAPRAGARVLAISDLDRSCPGGDLCEAAAALFSAGADLDLVVIGGAAAPACLAGIGSDREPPLVAGGARTHREPTFRVTRDDGRAGAPALAAGAAGAGAVQVAPGRIRVRIELDPPVEVGPLGLAPGGSLRIRLLEVPGSETPRWDVFVEGASTAAGAESAP